MCGSRAPEDHHVLSRRLFKTIDLAEYIVADKFNLISFFTPHCLRQNEFVYSIIPLRMLNIVFAGIGFIRCSGPVTCVLYSSDAADERSSVDVGGCRVVKKKS